MTTAELAVRDEAALEQPQHSTLFRTEDPAEIIVRASSMADELAKVVKKQRLTTKIQGKDHVRVEGWTLLGTLLGVFPVLSWTRQLDNGWEARVEARTLGGQVVGAAEAMCVRSERMWSNRDEYALRSMAQTRATSKALRQPLGFVMTLAGFEATPAEEMTFDADYEKLPDALKPNPDDVELEATREALTFEVVRIAEELGKRDEKEQAIAKNRGEKTLEAHVAWLRGEKVKGERALAALPS